VIAMASLRGLDLQSTPALLDILTRGLAELSNRAASSALSHPDLHDDFGGLASDAARLIAVVEVLADQVCNRGK